jgi:molecular chaperone IbpA
MSLQKIQIKDLNRLLTGIERHSIGMDDVFNNVFSNVQMDLNYPPHNTIEEENGSFVLEVALAGFNEKEISVYTEDNKLFICGTKPQTNRKYLHKGIANRSFKRYWNIPDGTEVKDVAFNDGLLSVLLEFVVPENHKKKVWFGSSK